MSSTERSTVTLPLAEQRQARRARELIEAAGGVDAAGEEAGKSHSQMSKYGRANYADSMPINVVEALEGITHGTVGHPIVTRYLAMRQGYALFPLREVTATGGDLLQLVARQAKESGDITQKVITALEDGITSPRECRDITREIDQLIDVAVCMRAELQHLEETSG